MGRTSSVTTLVTVSTVLEWSLEIRRLYVPSFLSFSGFATEKSRVNEH